MTYRHDVVVGSRHRFPLPQGARVGIYSPDGGCRFWTRNHRSVPAGSCEDVVLLELRACPAGILIFLSFFSLDSHLKCRHIRSNRKCFVPSIEKLRMSMVTSTQKKSDFFFFRSRDVHSTTAQRRLNPDELFLCLLTARTEGESRRAQRQRRDGPSPGHVVRLHQNSQRHRLALSEDQSRYVGVFDPIRDAADASFKPLKRNATKLAS